MERWLEARVVEQRRWTERLYSLSVEGPELRFEAGQFTRLALPEGDGMLARPYSFVSAPGEQPYEFHYVAVPDGPLSQRLAGLRRGDALYLSAAVSGFLVLAEVPDAEVLWMMATGTGIAPFLSILATEEPWRRFGRLALVHGVRHAGERSYRERLAALQRDRPGRLAVVDVVSRERVGDAIEGRIPARILDGTLELAAAAPLAAGASQVMLCGNPAMIADTVQALGARGMIKHRRRRPGQITLENYW